MVDVSTETRRSRGTERVALVFALLFPSLLTWCYFVLLAGSDPAIQQSVYAVGKIIQFLFPVAFTAFIVRERVRASRDWGRGLGEGVLSGLVILLAIGVSSRAG